MSLVQNSLLIFSLLLLIVGGAYGQRVFDMMDEPRFSSSGPSAFFQRKSYLQPFYTASERQFWRRSD